MKRILVLFVAVTAMVANLSWAQSVDRLPFASGTPSEGAFRELADKGIKTFIDLRNVEHVTNAARIEAEKAGATYYNIPVTGSKGVSKEQVDKFANIYENVDGLVLVNCGSGNRVGALWTSYQMSRGVASSVAIEEGRTIGMRDNLEKGVKARFCTEC